MHFAYAGWYYFVSDRVDRLRSFILNGIKKYNIRKVMVTTIYMERMNLITKEKMENYCDGKEDKESVNNDLEKLFEDIQLGKQPNDFVDTYFLPKLTKEELELVERKDEDFMKTFYRKMDADVDKAKMMMSESDSKFIYCLGGRKTFTIENSLPEKRIEESISNDLPTKKPRTVIETKNL